MDKLVFFLPFIIAASFWLGFGCRKFWEADERHWGLLAIIGVVVAVISALFCILFIGGLLFEGFIHTVK